MPLPRPVPWHWPCDCIERVTSATSIEEVLAYFHEPRTHLGWNRSATQQGDGEKDPPDSGIVRDRKVGNVGCTPELGGLLHRFYREDA